MIAHDIYELYDLMDNPKSGEYVCAKCKEKKPFGEFYMRLTGRSAGLRTGRCKVCTRASTLAWNITHPSDKKRLNKLYRERKRLKREVAS